MQPAFTGTFGFVLLMVITCSAQTLNTSLCTDIVIDDLHYYINSNSNNQNLVQTVNGTNLVYNLCKQVEVYCPYLNAVLISSLVAISVTNQTCTPYIQSSVALIDPNDISSGILVSYLSVGQQNSSISMNYQCNAGGIGCPSVSSGILWAYFEKGLLAYAITIGVVGVILMVFGVYIYRGSIVLIGWGTSVLILLMIESLFVFLRGVPEMTIQNVIILTLVCSFFVGYILGYFPKAGVFCLGLWIGGVIALTLNNIAFYYISSNPSNLALYIVSPVLCVGFGIIILYIRRAFITFASSLIGSYLTLRALSWYLGAFPNEFELSKKYHLGLAPAVPWQFYLYVIALLILTASSSALQTWLFKKKMSRVNATDDIQKHLDQMESSLRKQRDGLIEFKNVFQNEAKQSKVLTKQNNKIKPKSKTSIQEQSDEEEEENTENQHARDSYEDRELEENDSLPDYQQSSDGEPRNDELKKGLIRGKKR